MLIFIQLLVLVLMSSESFVVSHPINVRLYKAENNVESQSPQRDMGVGCCLGGQ